MSGIAALLRPAGGSTARPGTGIAAMMQAQRYRGPDGEGVVVAGDAAIGQSLLRTGRAGCAEPTRAAGGEVVLAFDGRLDASGDLGRQLGAPPAASDALLAALAYARWGDAVAERLEGDFAFVLWDARRRVLFGARDRFGVRPLFFGAGAGEIAVASDPRAVIVGLGTAPAPDDLWVAEYLSGQATDATLTPWRGVRALAPGTTLTVAEGRETLRTYWRLAVGPPPDGDRPARLRELLSAAVAERMRDAAAGVMLSGGLDSSAIAALAAVQGPPVPAFTLRFPQGSPLDEARHAEAVAAGRPIRLHRVAATPADAFGGWRELLAEQGAPFPAPGLGTTAPLYRAARQAGLDVLLDGHGGDEVVSLGFERLEVLARAGRFPSLWRNVRGAAPLSGQSALAMFLGLARRHPLLARLPGGGAGDPAAWRRIVAPALADRSGLVDRVRSHWAGRRPGATDPRALHAQLVTAPLVPRALEVLDRQAAHAGIDPRYPFFSRPLVEFCVSLPPEEKLAGGQTRRVLRRAMAGLLPEAVRLRRDKVDFAPRLAEGLAADLPFLRATLDRGRDRLAAYVATDVAWRHLDLLAREGAATPFPAAAELWRAVWLALWLESGAGSMAAGREAAE